VARTPHNHPAEEQHDELRVEAVSSAEAFVALRPEWERLLEAGAGASAFDTWWMAYHAWRMNRRSATPLVLVVRDQRGLCRGLLALGVQRFRRGSLTWRAIGPIAPRLLDFVDVVAPPQQRAAVLTAILGWLAENWREWDELRLSPIKEGAALASDVLLATPPYLEANLDPVSDNLAVAISENAEGWEDVCRGETRRGCRRILRRLEAPGFSTFRVSTGHPLALGIEALVGLHERRRSELGQISRLAAADQSALSALVADAVAHGGDLSVMEHDGGAIAAQLTLRLNGHVSHYRLAYDSRFRGVSPGIGLLIAGVDEAVKSGATEYDFGFGREDYKQRWANVERKVYRLRIANRHPGRLPRRLLSLAARLRSGRGRS